MNEYYINLKLLSETTTSFIMGFIVGVRLFDSSIGISNCLTGDYIYITTTPEKIKKMNDYLLPKIDVQILPYKHDK
jgi:hypothetical protein